MAKKIVKVEITPGCISCGTCAAICPAVFEVKGLSRVKDGVDLDEHSDLIRESAEMCPVGVILIEET